MIEQANGVLSESARLSMDDAFRALRAHALRTNTSLQAVAQGVVDRSIDIAAPRR